MPPRLLLLQQALKRIDTLLPLLAVLCSAAAATAALLVLGQGLAWVSKPVLSCGVVSLVAWLVHGFLTNFRLNFFFKDYVHAIIE